MGRNLLECVLVICWSLSRFLELVCLPADDDNGGNNDTSVY